VGRAPKLKKGDELIVVWVDITEDPAEEDDLEPYLLETGARFVKWRRSKDHGSVLLLSATRCLTKDHYHKPVGMIAIPKGCIRSIIKRVQEIEPKTDTGSSVGDG
jgi:hypothetical protein